MVCVAILLSQVMIPVVRIYLFCVLAAAGVFVVALPTAFIGSVMLGRSKKYYKYTFAAYLFGGKALYLSLWHSHCVPSVVAICWCLAAVALAIDTDAFDLFFVFCAAAALLGLIIWQIAVYELKMEYVYDPRYDLEGNVMAIDSMLVNLSSLIFVSAIPPERFEGEKVFLVKGFFASADFVPSLL